MQDPYRSARLLFVRHAQARAADDSYDEETPLSPLGQRQAATVAQALLGRAAPGGIYSSPFPRCLETARPLCDGLGVPARLDRRLREFEMEKTTLAAVLGRPDLLIWDCTHRGKATGETLTEFSRRVSECLEQIAEEHLGGQAIVFTHSGVIDAAVRWFVGLPPEAPWVHDLPLSNASITEVEFWPRGRVGGGAPRYTALLRVADTGHLADCCSEM
jgi:2,3-bisphosphoglycerate-dependent phosphoglycerate mutase